MGTAEAGFAFVLFSVVFMLGTDVFKVVNPSHHHFAAGSGAIMLEHVVERIEKDFEIGIGETSALSKSGRDVNLGGV